MWDYLFQYQPLRFCSSLFKICHYFLIMWLIHESDSSKALVSSSTNAFQTTAGKLRIHMLRTPDSDTGLLSYYRLKSHPTDFYFSISLSAIYS